MSNSNSRDTVIHLVAGAVAGTAGAIVTCPLEVVKTRLQSSNNNFHTGTFGMPKIASNNDSSHNTCKSFNSKQKRNMSTAYYNRKMSTHVLTFCAPPPAAHNQSIGLIQCLRNIVEHEGPRSLFKGLGPNIIGVAPSRAIYFCAYSQSKKFLNSFLSPDTAIVHVFSASFAGFTASSATNPIWFVKTRLQLDSNKNGKRLTTSECIRRIYSQSGLSGFYKGITASYFGISETVVHFVIYEALKAKLILKRHSGLTESENPNSRTSTDFVQFMICGAFSKTIASCLAYPHEVARTRLREEGNKYKGFVQTLVLVNREEGYRGLYRGLSIQLLRQIPNTAIMMATYEAVVYLLTTYFAKNNNDFYDTSAG